MAADPRQWYQSHAASFLRGPLLSTNSADDWHRCASGALGRVSRVPLNVGQLPVPKDARARACLASKVSESRLAAVEVRAEYHRSPAPLKSPRPFVVIHVPVASGEATSSCNVCRLSHAICMFQPLRGCLRIGWTAVGGWLAWHGNASKTLLLDRSETLQRPTSGGLPLAT